MPHLPENEVHGRAAGGSFGFAPFRTFALRSYEKGKALLVKVKRDPHLQDTPIVQYNDTQQGLNADDRADV